MLTTIKHEVFTMTNAALKVREEIVEEVVAEEVNLVSKLDEVDAMFEALEAEVEETVEVDISTVTEDEMIQAGVSASLVEARAEALAEMDEMSEPISDDSALVKKPAKEAKATVKKRISAVGIAKSQALRNSLGSKLADYLTLDVNDVSLDSATLTAKIDAKLEEIDQLPVKIQEKVVNFFAHLANGATLSNYSQIAIDLLVKNGEISSKQLRDAYLARPYSQGTANSQCTQLMRLLVVLGLATPAVEKLVANQDSTLLPIFSS